MVVGQNVYSQHYDCLTKLKIRYPKTPYVFNELSKSAVCTAGEKYEYRIELEKNTDYRLSFFASSSFNNNVNFRIINDDTGELIMDLPGSSYEDGDLSALQAYYDPNANKLIHPYFDLSPQKNLNLKIIIDVKEEDNFSGEISDGKKYNCNRGCVTIFIQSKESEPEGF
jgi:outer membrane receptor for Fe3+-dicitrate